VRRGGCSSTSTSSTSSSASTKHRLGWPAGVACGGKPPREQQHWPGHLFFMQTLPSEGQTLGFGRGGSWWALVHNFCASHLWDFVLSNIIVAVVVVVYGGQRTPSALDRAIHRATGAPRRAPSSVSLPTGGGDVLEPDPFLPPRPLFGPQCRKF
jgi:hypothetical protein